MESCVPPADPDFRSSEVLFFLLLGSSLDLSPVVLWSVDGSGPFGSGPGFPRGSPIDEEPCALRCDLRYLRRQPRQMVVLSNGSLNDVC